MVIIIDESQNLPVESLEQVRLLSNLETTRDKLLQIVLVGQPELVKIIDSFELRQLGQRISLACQLKPLSYDETVQYIQHRLNVASLKPQMPFEQGALRAVYNFSEGVPRLINMACDRMLLAACLKEQTAIKRSMADGIIEELSRRGQSPPAGFSWRRAAIPAVACALLIIAAGFFYHFKYQRGADTKRFRADQSQPVDTRARQDSGPAANGDQPEVAPEAVAPLDAQSASLPEVVEPPVMPASVMSLDELIVASLGTDSRRVALSNVLRQWGLGPQGDMEMQGVDDLRYFQLVAERHGLRAHVVKDDLEELARLNLPAVIRLDHAGSGEQIYASLIGIREGRYLFATPQDEVSARVEETELQARWGQVAVVPWKNYLGYRGVIPAGTPRSSVVVLKQFLWEIGYSQLTINERYDDQTRNAIKEIQAKNGLVVDGLVGDLTKIVLYNEKQGLPIPRLKQ